MSDVTRRVLEVLGRGRHHARFVPELIRVIGSEGDVEACLTALETGGRVLIREEYCPDPHLTGTDLRIVALIPEAAEDANPVGTAVADIESVWQRWLGEYLANHRCT